jgi:hypothetical protein
MATGLASTMTASLTASYEPDQDTQLDAGIKPYVAALRAEGVETFESCQGGTGHAFPVPTIRFHGDRAEGFRVLAVAQRHGLPVAELRRTWPVNDGEPTGPWWELTFTALAG